MDAEFWNTDVGRAMSEELAQSRHQAASEASLLLDVMAQVNAPVESGLSRVPGLDSMSPDRHRGGGAFPTQPAVRPAAFRIPKSGDAASLALGAGRRPTGGAGDRQDDDTPHPARNQRGPGSAVPKAISSEEVRT